MLLLCLTMLACIGESQQLTKIWVQNLSFNNSYNWSPHRVPCYADRAVYPRDLMFELQLLVPRVWVREVVLPTDGGLTLARDGELRLGGEDPAGPCPGEDVHFRHDIIQAWADPEKWRIESVLTQEARGEGGPAVPHLERLPCSSDQAVFPEGSTLVVELPSITQTVRSISFAGQLLDNRAWQDLVTSEPLTFYRVADSQEPPVVVSGAAAGTEGLCQTHAVSGMCHFVKCEPPRCLEPVRPIFHCCDICGATIELEGNLDLPSIRREVFSQVSDTNVRWWVGWIPANEGDGVVAQVVLVDGEEYDGTSSRMAPLIKAYLEREFNLTVSSKLYVSGLPWRGAEATRGGWEAGVMLVATLVALAALLLYYYPSRRTFTSFHFARFDNRSREGSLVLGISQLSLDKAFDNPMYAATTAVGYKSLVEQKAKVAEEVFEAKEGIPESPDLTEEEELQEETTFKE